MLLLVTAVSVVWGSVHRLELHAGSTFHYYEGGDGTWGSGTAVALGASFTASPNSTTADTVRLALPPYEVELGKALALGESPAFSLQVPAQSSGNDALRAFAQFPTKQDEVYRLARLVRPSGSARLYIVLLRSYSPYVLFGVAVEAAASAQGNTSDVYECDVTHAVGGPSQPQMKCRNGGGETVARFEPLAFAGGSAVAQTFYLADGVPSVVVEAWLTLAVHRLRGWAQMDHETDLIKDNNDERRSQARATTGGLFFLVAVGMVLWSLMFALLVSWWLPVIPNPASCMDPENVLESKVRFNCIVMSFAAVVLNFTVSAAGGFTGWIVFGLLYFIGALVVVFVFICKRCCCKSSRVAPGEEEGKEAENGNPKPKWASLSVDLRLGKKQRRLLVGYCLLLLVTVIVMLVVVYTWEIAHYKVFDRKTQVVVTEDIPDLTAKAVQVMYAWNGLATNMKLHLYTKWLTQWCGRRYRQHLSDREKDVEIKEKFIDEYAIDMSEYTPAHYRMYPTVNEWFIRHLAPGARPEAGGRLSLAAPLPAEHQRIVLSPADCRVLVFPTLEASRVWVKGSRFNYAELLDDVPPWQGLFAGGAMVIARLAPQDYHRFTSPLTGTIVAEYEIDGTYWSVNADAAKSKNYAFYNLRKVLVLRYAGSDGTDKYMAYVAIGATCVGSVIFSRHLGANVTAGDELGIMQFGGSTVIMLFQAGQLLSDDDLLVNSAKPVETLIKVKERLGVLA